MYDTEESAARLAFGQLAKRMALCQLATYKYDSKERATRLAIGQQATHKYDSEESATRLAFDQRATRMYGTEESAARLNRLVHMAQVVGEPAKAWHVKKSGVRVERDDRDNALLEPQHDVFYVIVVVHERDALPIQYLCDRGRSMAQATALTSHEWRGATGGENAITRP